MDQYIGYPLMAVGIIVLIMALLIGYGIYATASDNISTLGVLGTAGGSSTINGSVSNLSEGLDVATRVGVYTFIEIAVLFLMATIGYKLAYLGYQIERGDRGQQQPKQEKIR